MQNEQSIIDQFLSQLAGLLGPLSPFTKAVVPAVLGLAYAVINVIVTGTLNASALTAAIGAVVLAVLVFELPNIEKKPAPVPAPVPAPPVPPTPAPVAKVARKRPSK